MSVSRLMSTRTVTLCAVTLTLACSGPDATDVDARTPPAETNPATLAKQLVAEFLSVPITDVTLVSNQEREFSDSSLGCPEPGISYLQALTQGQQVIVEADGRRFDIRVSGGHAKICHRQKSRKNSGNPSPGTQASALIDLARRDLAGFLQTDVKQIAVLQVRPFDAGMPIAGCAPDCKDSKDQCGYMIGLFHDGRRYEYHANQNKVEPCPPILTM
jgi:hypothetical protein